MRRLVAFLILSLLTGVTAYVLPACEFGCFDDFDCTEGSFCGAQKVCISHCQVDTDCPAPRCQSACCPATYCSQNGRCVTPLPFTDCEEEEPTDIEGWDDPPGTGVTFIVNQIAIAGKERGFNIDGKCDEAGCIDNHLWRLGELGNDQIRQALLGGESLLLVEIAGLDQPYRGYDSSITLKFYSASDADDPFFPANNFKVPPGHTNCCEFQINSQSLQGNVARSRIPARIEDERILPLTTTPNLLLMTGLVSFELNHSVVSGRLPRNLKQLNDGLLGGAVTFNSLASIDNPYCRTVSPRCPVATSSTTKLIDLVSTLLGPAADVDVDGDGWECAIDTDGDGEIDTCCDAGSSRECIEWDTCIGERVGPLSDHPRSCAQHSRMADGFSVGITFNAIAAKIVGVAGMGEDD